MNINLTLCKITVYLINEHRDKNKPRKPTNG